METMNAADSESAGPTARRGVWLLLGVLTLARLFAASWGGLSEDEMYYRLWGLFPTYGYLDHPPMVAWWIAAGRMLAGDNALGIRLLSVLSVVVGTLALHRTAILLTESRKLADRAAVWLQAVFLIGIGSVVMTPDAPLVMFWSLALWAAAELDHSRNPRWLVALGVFAGLGLQSKYSGLFFGAGFMLWISTDARSRCWWRRPELYLGGLLALLIVSPVIWWNAHHQWASFAKQFGRVAGNRFTLRYTGEFLVAAFGLLNPLVAILAAVPLAALVRGKPNDSRPVWFLVAHSLPFAAYLVVHSFHDRVQANWPAPLFPSLCLLAVLGSQRCEQSGGRVLRRLVPLVAPVGIGLSLVVLALTVWSCPLLPVKFDVTRRARGWDELSNAVGQAQTRGPAAWIATDRYALTGTLAYGLRDTRPQTPVVQLTERIRYANLPVPPASLLQSPGLYVTLDRNDRSADLRRYFGEVEPAGTINRTVRNKVLGTYRLYEISRPKDPGLTLDALSDQLTGPLRHW